MCSELNIVYCVRSAFKVTFYSNKGTLGIFCFNMQELQQASHAVLDVAVIKLDVTLLDKQMSNIPLLILFIS